MPYVEKHETRMRKFMEKVSTDEATGCMNWTGSMLHNGYGQVGWRGRLWTAHRAFWVFSGNADPGAMDLDHVCRNRCCINPAHLRVVTRSENLRAGFLARGCKNGHPFRSDDFSTVRRSDGTQELRCKVCHRERNKRAKSRSLARSS
jgi:hypothetical protein